jgi:hypothetical protein
MKIRVLFEDRLAQGQPPRGYGPHAFLCACVADEAATDLRLVRESIDSKPCKGNGNVVKECENAGYSATAFRLVAVLDEDKVRGLFNLPGNSCKSAIRTAFDAKVAPAGVILADRLVLLESNLESLIDAIRWVEGLQPLAEKPGLNVRDIALNRAARGPRERRDLVRAALPSFDRLVRIVARALGAVPAGPHMLP